MDEHSHIHYKASDAWEKAFIDTFTKYNAMGCVLVDMQYLERGIAFAKAHPDRVIPYAAVKIDSSTVLKDIQRAYFAGTFLQYQPIYSILLDNVTFEGMKSTLSLRKGSTETIGDIYTGSMYTWHVEQKHLGIINQLSYSMCTDGVR